MLVCGGGNGAHVLSGLSGMYKFEVYLFISKLSFFSASREKTEVRVCSLFQDEAARWEAAAKKQGHMLISYKDSDKQVFEGALSIYIFSSISSHAGQELSENVHQ